MIENELVEKGLIPLDKSWIIRMGVLDMLHGYTDIIDFLNQYQLKEKLGDDLEALLRCAKAWGRNEPLDVGEAGTLYRMLKFAGWKQGLKLEFITRGTLSNRPITDDPSIITWSQKKHLTLDGGTSQWASAAVIVGEDEERLTDAPYKLMVSYMAIDHWKKSRADGKVWQPQGIEQFLLRQKPTSRCSRRST